MVKTAVPAPPVRTLPPVGLAYQSIVKPAPGLVTETEVEPDTHIEPPVAPVGALGNELQFDILTVKIPVPLKEEDLYFAGEVVLPHVPLTTPAPPRVKVLTVNELVPIPATAPLIARFPLMVTAAPSVFVPVPERIRFV